MRSSIVQVRTGWRNFFRRVEVCFPIENPDLKSEMIKYGLKVFLKDNTRAWVLQEDGSYICETPADGEAFIAQQKLLEQYAAEIT